MKRLLTIIIILFSISLKAQKSEIQFIDFLKKEETKPEINTYEYLFYNHYNLDNKLVTIKRTYFDFSVQILNSETFLVEKQTDYKKYFKGKPIEYVFCTKTKIYFGFSEKINEDKKVYLQEISIETGEISENKIEIFTIKNFFSSAVKLGAEPIPVLKQSKDKTKFSFSFKEVLSSDVKSEYDNYSVYVFDENAIQLSKNTFVAPHPRKLLENFYLTLMNSGQIIIQAEILDKADPTKGLLTNMSAKLFLYNLKDDQLISKLFEFEGDVERVGNLTLQENYYNEILLSYASFSKNEKENRIVLKILDSDLNTLKESKFFIPKEVGEKYLDAKRIAEFENESRANISSGFRIVSDTTFYKMYISDYSDCGGVYCAKFNYDLKLEWINKIGYNLSPNSKFVTMEQNDNCFIFCLENNKNSKRIDLNQCQDQNLYPELLVAYKFDKDGNVSKQILHDNILSKNMGQNYFKLYKVGKFKNIKIFFEQNYLNKRSDYRLIYSINE